MGMVHTQATGVGIGSFSLHGTHSPSLALGNTPSTMIEVPLSPKMPIPSRSRDGRLTQAPGSPPKIGILNRIIIKAEIHPVGCALKEQSPTSTAWILKVWVLGHLFRATEVEIDTHMNIYITSQL